MTNSFALPSFEAMHKFANGPLNDRQREHVFTMVSYLSKQDFIINALPNETTRNDFINTFTRFMALRCVTEEPILDAMAFGYYMPMTQFILPTDSPSAWKSESVDCLLNIYMTSRPFDFVFICTEYIKLNLEKHNLDTEHWDIPERNIFDKAIEADPTPLAEQYKLLDQYMESPGRVLLDSARESYKEAIKFKPKMITYM